MHTCLVDVVRLQVAATRGRPPARDLPIVLLVGKFGLFLRANGFDPSFQNGFESELLNTPCFVVESSFDAIITG
jgi:hypothetical protein